uniref:Uncharacterized protein n=1 Tax=virus sp. ct1Uu26 TaxID=2826789 RepID=A0A8S5R7V6_9VIRU|nr:MAG TPA: hypothetical protein [virus sp. ct1Uu26]
MLSKNTFSRPWATASLSRNTQQISPQELRSESMLTFTEEHFLIAFMV